MWQLELNFDGGGRCSGSVTVSTGECCSRRAKATAGASSSGGVTTRELNNLFALKNFSFTQ